LQRNYDILKRKYNNLDLRYKEAKRQNQALKNDMRKKSDRWREWYQWWSSQKQKNKSKGSVSPPKPQMANPESQAEPSRPGIPEKRDIGRYPEFEYLNEDEDEIDETEFIHTTFDPDAVASRRETQPASQLEEKDRYSLASLRGLDIPPKKGSDIFEKRLQPKKIEEPNTPLAPKYGIDEDNKKAIRDANLSARKTVPPSASKTREIIELLDSPEKAVSKLGTIPAGSTPTSSLNLSPTPRPRSAPAQTRTSKVSTPISARPAQRKKKVKGYPSMSHWTEDGTDGTKPLPPSPTEDDTGLLTAMLEGPPPGPPGIASPLPLPQRKEIPATPEHTTSENVPVGKTGRVRELLENESDNGAGYVSSDGREVKRQKGNKTMSEPRLRRQILSPDLASKNKGRGRYAASVVKR
jgi:hypothetical protein